MGSKSFNSLLLCLAIFGAILISQGAVEARGLGSPFCRTAKFRGLCNRMVRGAATPRDASLQALDRARGLATRLPALTTAIAEVVNFAVGNPEAKDAVIRQCNQVFADAVDNIDQSIAAVQVGDPFTAAIRLSAITFSDCSDAMEGFGVVMPTNRVVKQFKRHISSCLAIVQA